MRITHVETINNVAHGYAAGLDHLGHTSTFYEPSLRGAGAPLSRKLAAMPARVLDLRRGVRMLTPAQCDIAHIHWASYGVVGMLGHVPFVVHCHGADVRRRAYDPRFRGMLRLIFSRAAAVLCITPDLSAPVRTLRPDALLVPAAIDTSAFVPAPMDQSAPWTVLLFARLDVLKGAPVAVRALEAFHTLHPDARILLMRYGPLSGEYERRYAGRFTFVPKQPPNAVRAIIQQADVVVGQFFLGALGLSELQAMSCAKPVIVSYRYPHAYPEPPPVYDAQTSPEILAHLERLYVERGEARTQGIRARAWVQRFHDPIQLARQLEGIYADALARANR